MATAVPLGDTDKEAFPGKSTGDDKKAKKAEYRDLPAAVAVEATATRLGTSATTVATEPSRNRAGDDALPEVWVTFWFFESVVIFVKREQVVQCSGVCD